MTLAFFFLTTVVGQAELHHDAAVAAWRVRYNSFPSVEFVAEGQIVTTPDFIVGLGVPTQDLPDHPLPFKLHAKFDFRTQRAWVQRDKYQWNVPFLVPSTGGGACDFDCYEVRIMGGVSNGTPYCYFFAEMTGRLVWSDMEPMFGTVYQVDCGGEDPNYQDAERWSGCPAVCPLTQIPQELQVKVTYVGELSFGCYRCSG